MNDFPALPAGLDTCTCTLVGDDRTPVVTMRRDDGVELAFTIEPRMAHQLADDFLRISARARAPREGKTVTG